MDDEILVGGYVDKTIIGFNNNPGAGLIIFNLEHIGDFSERYVNK